MFRLKNTHRPVVRPVGVFLVTNQLVWMEKHVRDGKTRLLYNEWDVSKPQKWADKRPAATFKRARLISMGLLPAFHAAGHRPTACCP